MHARSQWTSPNSAMNGTVASLANPEYLFPTAKTNVKTNVQRRMPACRRCARIAFLKKNGAHCAF